MLDVNFDVNQAIKDAEAALGKYGPVIVDAAKHQVAAQAHLALLWTVVLAVAAAVCLAVVFGCALWARAAARADGYGDGFGQWMCVCLFVLAFAGCLIGAGSNYNTYYQLTNAPDWAALQLLKP